MSTGAPAAATTAGPGSRPRSTTGSSRLRSPWRRSWRCSTPRSPTSPLPYIAGGMAVGRSQSTWVLTSYLVANAIVLPLSGWLMGSFGRKRFYMTCVLLFTISSALCGAAPSIEPLDLLPRPPGAGRRRAPALGAGHPGGHLPAPATGHGDGDVRRGRRRRADPRARAGRLHQRQLFLALDLLHQYPHRHRLADPDQHHRPGPARDGRGGPEELEGAG